MWVVLLVTIHLLVGPSVTVVSDFGPYTTRAACESDLPKVRGSLPEADQVAANTGELAVVCVAVSDYRTLVAPESND